MPTDAASLALGKDLVGLETLSPAQLRFILDTAEPFKEVSERAIKKVPALRGKTIVNLFFEASTRTRISFEAAAKRLSADVINFSAKGSSVSKGESLKDTALTLEAMGADGVVVRHWASGAPHRLAHSGWIRSSVVNAGDGTHEHPTQALLDAYTLRRHLGSLGARRITIVGDVLHSRVARSNVLLLATLGADVTLVGPPTLLPVGVEIPACVEVGDDEIAMFDTAEAGLNLVGQFAYPVDRNAGADWQAGRFPVEQDLGRVDRDVLDLQARPLQFRFSVRPVERA